MKKSIIASGLLLSTLLNAQTFSLDSNAPSESVNTGYLLQGGVVIASDPSDTATVGTGSAACHANSLHADNSYYRYFDIDGLGQIDITDIDIGIQSAASGTGADQPIVIRIHSIPDGATLPSATLTLVTEMTTTVANAAQATANFPISANLDSATNDLVVEVHTPEGQTDGHSFFFGANDSNEVNPFFISSDACGLGITNVADIAFPDMHGIMVVNGNTNVPVELMNFSID